MKASYWVEGDDSIKLEADIAAGWADNLFIKSTASGKAEEESAGAPSLNSIG